MDWPDEPVWREYRKHKPPPNILWKKLVKDTGKSESAAFYHPAIDIEYWEMLCVCESLNQKSRNSNGSEIIANEELRHPNIREFWMHCERIIGASDGKETEYIFVQWEVYGDMNEVHGRPMTGEQLRRRGVEI